MAVRAASEDMQPSAARRRNQPMQGQQKNSDGLDQIASHQDTEQGWKPPQIQYPS